MIMENAIEKYWVVVDNHGFIQSGSTGTFSIMTVDQHFNKTPSYWSYHCGMSQNCILGLITSEEAANRIREKLQAIADYVGFDLTFKVDYIDYNDLKDPNHPYALKKQWNAREHLGKFTGHPKHIHIDIPRGQVGTCRQFLKDIGAVNHSKWDRCF